MDSEAAQTTGASAAPAAIPDSVLSAATAVVSDPASLQIDSARSGSYWTAERRAAFAEKTRARHAARKASGTSAVSTPPAPPVNPFALTEDREFQQPSVDHVDIYRVTGGGHPHPIGSFKPGQVPLDTLPAAVASISTAPAIPGTPASPYRHCPCLGVMPGRTCPACLGSHWVKLCPKCEGTGRLDRAQRTGASRSEVCSGCMGRGEAPAAMAEVRAIQAAAAMAAVPEPAENAGEDDVFRRAVRLPGIGVTSRKRREKVRPRKKAGEKAKRQPQIQFGKRTEQ